MKPSPYPFCVNCAHCKTVAEVQPIFPQHWFDPHKEPYCDYAVNVVTGLPGIAPCEDVRKITGSCGIEGRLFEPKEAWRHYAKLAEVATDEARELWNEAAAEPMSAIRHPLLVEAVLREQTNAAGELIGTPPTSKDAPLIEAIRRTKG